MRRHLGDVEPHSPVAFDSLDRLEPLFEGRRPGVVVRANSPGEDADQHERTGALRIGRREEQRHAAAFRVSNESRPLAAYGVENRPNVVHPLFERRQTPV